MWQATKPLLAAHRPISQPGEPNPSKPIPRHGGIGTVGSKKRNPFTNNQYDDFLINIHQ